MIVELIIANYFKTTWCNVLLNWFSCFLGVFSIWAWNGGTTKVIFSEVSRCWLSVGNVAFDGSSLKWRHTVLRKKWMTMFGFRTYQFTRNQKITSSSSKLICFDVNHFVTQKWRHIVRLEAKETLVNWICQFLQFSSLPMRDDVLFIHTFWFTNVFFTFDSCHFLDELHYIWLSIILFI